MLYTLPYFTYFSDVKRGVFKNIYWSFIVLLAFAAIQLLPALFQPIHHYIYWNEQSDLAQLDAGSARLESLRMTEASFAAIQEEEHEITWNGKRYDIKSVRYINGYVELLVKYDTLETKLKRIVQLIDGSSAKHSGSYSAHQFYAFYFEKMSLLRIVNPTRHIVELKQFEIKLGTLPIAVIAPPPRA